MGAFLLWAGATILAQSYFIFDSNAPRKRMLWPVFLVAAGAGFIAVIALTDPGTPGLYLMVPAVLLIGLLQYFKVRFCGKCGATVGQFTRGIMPAERCSNCGAGLVPKT